MVCPLLSRRPLLSPIIPFCSAQGATPEAVLVAEGAAVLGEFGFVVAAEESKFEVLAQLPEGEQEAVAAVDLVAGVEEQFFLVGPGGEQQAEGGVLADMRGEPGVEGESGEVAIFGGEAEFLAGRGGFEREAGGSRADGGVSSGRLAEVGQRVGRGLFRPDMAGLHGGVNQQKGG